MKYYRTIESFVNSLTLFDSPVNTQIIPTGYDGVSTSVHLKRGKSLRYTFDLYTNITTSLYTPRVQPFNTLHYPVGCSIYSPVYPTEDCLVRGVFLTRQARRYFYKCSFQLNHYLLVQHGYLQFVFNPEKKAHEICKGIKRELIETTWQTKRLKDWCLDFEEVSEIFDDGLKIDYDEL